MGREKTVGAPEEARARIGVVASNVGALREVTCLLAMQRVSAARTIVPAGELPETRSAGFLDGLSSLQQDPEIEIVVAIVADTVGVDEDQVLARIAASDRPTVLCLLGGKLSRAWQAGAIPARRLDEAAQRAVAWVRGWDQALVSSLLEEQDEELMLMAAGLKRLVGTGPRGIVAILSSEALCREAWMILGEATGDSVYLDCAEPSPQRIHDALTDPGTGVILLALMLEGATSEAVADEAAAALERLQGPGPLVIAHVCGTDLAAVGRAQMRLGQAGVTIARSNAAAARLARLVVSP